MILNLINQNPNEEEGKEENREAQIKAMNFAYSQLFLSILILFFYFLASQDSLQALGQQIISNGLGRRGRFLMSFKENPEGTNATFECSVSGPCLPCLYSEKGDEKYHCSETGYRIPFKCIEIKDAMKDSKETNSQNAHSFLEVFDNSEKHRILIDDSSASNSRLQAYITYRSCIPPASATEEKLSVLGFEGVVIFLLLVSGSFIYLKKKQAVSVSGLVAGRVSKNSRF